MIDISIALATRGRPQSLSRLLQSIKNKVRRVDSIEVLLGVDYCDESLKEILAIARSYAFSVFVLVQKRAQNISDDYLNRLFSTSRGRWLWVLNDDVEVLTDAFDDVIRSKADIGSVYLDTKDNTRNYNGNGEFACFPIINRKAFNALGCFFPPGAPTWGADKVLWQICNQARIVKDASDIEVNHYMDIKDDAHNHMKEGLRKRGIDVNIDDYAQRIKR